MIYDLTRHCGHLVDVPKDATPDDKKKILDGLIEHANLSLPKGTVFEIRERIKDDGQPWAAWAYEPAEPYEKESNVRLHTGELYYFKHPGTTMKQEPLFMKKLDEGELDQSAGFSIVGRMEA